MATKTSSKITTDLSERCDVNARGKWLGIARLTRLPDTGFPPRETAQLVVTDVEKLAGEKIISEYRAAETVAEKHDADRISRDLDRLGGNGAHGFDRADLRKELGQCDRQTFLDAEQKMTELRDQAIALVKPILERLVDQFDTELTEVALAREAELAKLGAPLFIDKLDTRGVAIREYPLHDDPVVTALQCRREVARRTSIVLNRETSIGACQWLTSSEQGVPFGWPL